MRRLCNPKTSCPVHRLAATSACIAESPMRRAIRQLVPDSVDHVPLEREFFHLNCTTTRRKHWQRRAVVPI